MMKIVPSRCSFVPLPSVSYTERKENGWKGETKMMKKEVNSMFVPTVCSPLVCLHSSVNGARSGWHTNTMEREEKISVG